LNNRPPKFCPLYYVSGVLRKDFGGLGFESEELEEEWMSMGGFPVISESNQ